VHRAVNGTAPTRTIKPTGITRMNQNSHRRLDPTDAISVTPNIPHAMIRRSAHQQNSINDMLAETIQQENHSFSLPTGATIRSATRKAMDATIIIMPEMGNVVIFSESGKPPTHQELITILRYEIKWIRSTANEIHRLYKTNSIRFIRKSSMPPGSKATNGSFVVDIKEHKEERERTILTVGGDQI
jgi:hypothetical protein